MSKLRGRLLRAWTALFSMANVVAYGGEKVKGSLLQNPSHGDFQIVPFEE